MKRILTKLLICAAAFGTAFAAARSGHSALDPDSSYHSKRKSSPAGVPVPEVRHDAGSELKELLSDASSAEQKIGTMTPDQIRQCLDTLYAAMRLDREASETGSKLLAVWLTQEPFAAFHWCQARHFEFAGKWVTQMFEHMASINPAQAYACCAKLHTVSLRVSALQGIALVSQPGEESATLDRLLAFGGPGAEAASAWMSNLRRNRQPAAVALKSKVKAMKEMEIKWRAQALEYLGEDFR